MARIKGEWPSAAKEGLNSSILIVTPAKAGAQRLCFFNALKSLDDPPCDG